VLGWKATIVRSPLASAISARATESGPADLEANFGKGKIPTTKRRDSGTIGKTGVQEGSRSEYSSHDFYLLA